MSEAIPLAAADVAPPRDAVLEQLGIPAGTALAGPVEDVYARASELFAATVAPAGAAADLTAGAFAAVYAGEGRNAARTPVEAIAARAEHRAVFAVTLGQPLGGAIARSFSEEDFALGCVLDALASVAADAAAAAAERWYAAALRGRGWSTPDGAVLRYSPGYCGWDITGQRMLFAALGPGRAGITLTDSCLMQPLKSVSGVLIAGPRSIHRFPPDFDFCDRCEARTCRDRLAALAAAARG